jgi:hypothetical protein
MRRRHGKRRNRKVSGGDAVRNHRIGISVNNVELSRLERRANKANMTLSRYCREQALEREVCEADKAALSYLLEQKNNLGKIGSNINQIAHALNANRMSYVTAEKLMEEANKLMKSINTEIERL